MVSLSSFSVVFFMVLASVSARNVYEPHVQGENARRDIPYPQPIATGYFSAVYPTGSNAPRPDGVGQAVGTPKGTVYPIATSSTSSMPAYTPPATVTSDVTKPPIYTNSGSSNGARDSVLGLALAGGLVLAAI